VITSPPYEEAHDKKIGGLADKDRPDLVPYSWVKTDNPQNIGNLKEESYLQAMLLVYRQCYKILRPKGLMILIVKPFIREKKVIPLQEDTKSLCEKAGFSFVEEHYRILPSQSFWRILYHKKFPGVPLIDKEYVLVFKKECSENTPR